MKIQIWHIDGKGGFHLGRHGLGQEETGDTFASDSLFAALVVRMAARRGAAAVDAWLQQFQKDPPVFVLSSAFPRAGNIHFFPVPLQHPVRDDSGVQADAKKMKKVRFVSQTLFQRLLNGDPLAGVLDQSLPLQNGALLIAEKEKPALPATLQQADHPVLWQIERRPRVTIDRVAAASNIYFTGRTAFAADCGLWFGVRWLQQDGAAQQELMQLLADLGDAGIGGERSSGFGAAQITAKGEMELPDAGEGAWVSLSRYLPKADEIAALLDSRSAYSLAHVGGWIDSPNSKSQRRRAVNLLQEGSVLGVLPRVVPGSLEDVQPVYGGENHPLSHPVWRCGQALAVGMKAGGKK